MINYNIDVYLRHTEMENMYVRELIELVTNDYNGNVFNFTIYDTDKKAYDLTSKTVSLIVKSELGTVIEDNCTIVNALSGTAKITLPSDMFCEKGTYYAELQIWEGLNRITSLPFDYTVRLSLDSNEAVKADNRFNLLQQALSNVSNADAVSKEALQTANNAKTIVDDLVPKTNQAAQNAQEALDRATGVATKEELNNKIGHDGIFDETNFDFIRSKVVQDGLVSSIINFDLSTPQKRYDVGISNKCTFIINLNITNIDANPWYAILYDSSGIYEGELSIIGKRHYMYLNGTHRSTNNLNEGMNKIIIMVDGENVTTILNGVCSTSKQNSGSVLDFKYMNLGNLTGKVAVNGSIDMLIYNRILTSKEINNNFQVLNNSPSISQLTTTNADGSKSPYKLASDSEHVVYCNGYNAEECLSGIYDMCKKEFVSTDGSAITIPNAIDKSKILSAEIKGQTVKNLCLAQSRKTLDSNSRFCHLTNSELTGTTYHMRLRVESVTSGITELRVLYTLANGAEGVYGTPFRVSGAGVYELDLTIPNLKLLNNVHIPSSTASGESITISGITIVESSNKSKLQSNKVLQFGLNSTEATIDCNGLKYTFYHPTETNTDGSRKVILLGSVVDAYDTSELKTDGSRIDVKNTKDAVLNGSENWTLAGTQLPNTVTAMFDVDDLFVSESLKRIIASSFKTITLTSEYNTLDEEFICTLVSLKRIAIRVLKSKLSTPDIAGIKAWLQANNEPIKYQIPTVVTIVPKELVPTIALNDKTNICKVDSAVAPSEFTIVAPVTDPTKTYKLVPINGWINTNASDYPTLQGYLGNDNKVRIVGQLTASSNSNFVALPQDLRPNKIIVTGTYTIHPNGNITTTITNGTVNVDIEYRKEL